MRITLDCNRDSEGRLAGTVWTASRADADPLPFSGIVELVERIEAIEATCASSSSTT